MYPCVRGELAKGATSGKVHQINYSGMSIRDHFAGLAMQGQFGAIWRGENEEPSDCEMSETTAATIAGSAYAMADAMLKAREK